jgi:hypothetical protein
MNAARPSIRLTAAVLLAGSFIGLSGHPASAAKRPAMPIVIGGAPELDACSSTAQVVRLSSGKSGFLSVRTSPSTKSAELDRLRNGFLVFLCGYDKGDFTAIIYAKDKSMDCGVSTPIVPAKTYRGPCASGWAATKYLDVIAG